MTCGIIQTCSIYQMLDQAVKYLEDMQDDFDFRYKTLQLRGEPSNDHDNFRICTKNVSILVFYDIT